MRIVRPRNVATIPSVARLAIAFFALVLSAFSFAHLMPAQRGTLNIVDGSAYAVIAIPVAHFDDVDLNADGAVSLSEFDASRKAIASIVKREFMVGKTPEKNSMLQISDLVLSPELQHASPGQQVNQVTIMGRFELNDSDVRALSIRCSICVAARDSRLVLTIRDSANARTAVLSLTAKSPDESISFVSSS